jgi:hypothetical protein
MEIRNVSREVLDFALSEVNRHFDGNIRFKRCEYMRRTRDGGEVWRVQLTVRNRAEREQCDECGEQRDADKHRTKVQCKASCETKHTWRDEHHRYRRGQTTCGVGRRSNPWRGERYTSAACWHAHGVFFDALPTVYYGREVLIISRVGKFTPEDDWRNNPSRDMSVGSQFCPMRASEQCDCWGGGPTSRENISRFESVPDQE